MDDRFPLWTDRCAQVDQDGVPDDGTDRREHQEESEIHVRHSCWQRDQAPDQRHETAEKDCPETVAVESGIRFVDISMRDAQNVAVLVDDLIQSFNIQKGTKTVKNRCTDYGTDCRRDNHQGDVQFRGGCHKTAKSQNDFRRNRRKKIFDRNQKCYTEVAELLHNALNPSFDSNSLLKN